ncbi:hypothetical protein FRB93_009003 [Tulasnella sp. JGI-2019a]|nr:hypothetical protein FRB93_009003 [Tulasnella sp. JGI-2019a]
MSSDLVHLDTNPTAPNFHNDFNFDDGNIILQAMGSLTIERRKPPKPVCFRVHKSVLKSQSKTFADMFQLCPVQAEGEESLHDGVPILDVWDDSDNIRKLMEVLYMSIRVPTAALSNTSACYFQAVLYMADKYDMNRVFQAFLPRVVTDWPLTLSAWDQLRDRILAERRKSALGGKPFMLVADRPFIDPAEAICFSRRFYSHAGSILPSAFYSLSCLSREYDVYEVEGETTMKPSVHRRLAFEQYVRSGGIYTEWDILSKEDMEAVYVGQAAIRRWLSKCGEYPKDALSMGSCASCAPRRRSACDKSSWWMGRISGIIRGMALEEEMDVLEGLRQLANNPAVDHYTVCDTCFQAIQRHILAQRLALWESLPAFFRVKKPDGWAK